MKILIKSLAGGNFHLDIDPADTVRWLFRANDRLLW